jgi:NTE family protein
VFAPGPAEQAAMGNDMMSRARVNEVIRESFLAAGRAAATPAAAAFLRLAAAGG